VLQQFDDVKVGYDNDADGDIADAGDDIQVLDSFDSSVMSLSYGSECDQGGSTNGNLTLDTPHAAPSKPATRHQSPPESAQPRNPSAAEPPRNL
jgi:hypothetical protein